MGRVSCVVLHVILVLSASAPSASFQPTVLRQRPPLRPRKANSGAAKLRRNYNYNYRNRCSPGGAVLPFSYSQSLRPEATRLNSVSGVVAAACVKFRKSVRCLAKVYRLFLSWRREAPWAAAPLGHHPLRLRPLQRFYGRLARQPRLAAPERRYSSRFSIAARSSALHSLQSLSSLKCRCRLLITWLTTLPRPSSSLEPPRSHSGGATALSR